MATADSNHNQLLELSEVPFAGYDAAFLQAQARTSSHTVTLCLAGRKVLVRVVGECLADNIRSAFAHLLVENLGGEPDLRIDCWDVEASGVAPDRRAAPAPDVAMMLKASVDGRYVGEYREHSSQWLDRHEKRILAYTESASRLNLDERARPFHKMISVWLGDQDVQFVHAGLIEFDGRGILFVGNGGAGKSTSSIACLLGGLGYLGDDFVALEECDEHFVGHGLFASCLLDNHHIRRFPDLLPHARSAHHAHEDKMVLYLGEAFASTMASRTHVEALVLPCVVAGEATRWRPASRAEALFALAPTSVMFLAKPNADAFQRLTRLVESIPCYWLELGPDVENIPRVVRDLAARLESGRDVAVCAEAVS